MRSVKGRPAALVQGMRLDTAFCAVMQANVVHLRASERGLLRSRDPEYLHQMRVTLRRLRSAIEVFAPVVPGRAASLRKDLKWISGELGEARDWDVFATETLSLAGQDPQSRLKLTEFAVRCERLRRVASVRARRAVRSARCRSLIRALAAGLPSPPRAGRSGGGTTAVLQPLVDDYAPAVLEWHYGRLKKAGGKPSRLSPRELHRFRVELKKFRYAAHFFAGLFPPRAERDALARLSRLQDILGAINDAAVAEKLAATVCVGARGRRLRGAKRLICDWSLERAGALRGELNHAWRKFRALGKYW